MLTGAEAYFTEPVRQDLHHQLRLRGIVYSGRTKYQAVDIIETVMGRTLALDGRTQSAEADEFIYHEALVHPALVSHPKPRAVFIGGGGEGATLREALAHKTVRRAIMCDLDGELVELCRLHLPKWHRGAFDDKRTQLVIGDAKACLESQPANSLDVIVMDITDPMEGGPSLPLFTKDFYRMALGKLAPGGILVTQAGPAGIGMGGVFTAIANTLKAAAGHVHPYRTAMLSFGSDWGFAMAGRDGPVAALSPAEVDRRVKARISTTLRFYDGESHAGLFALPKWLRDELARERHVIGPDSHRFTA
jgi:spermidine synthase